MKSRITGILLVFVLVGPPLVTTLWMQYKKSAIKKSVKWRIIDGIEKEALVLLKFAKEEVDTKVAWEHAREFEYNHEMYDVVEKQIVGDSVYYYCWWDHEETKLNKQLSQVVSDLFGNNQQKKDTQNRLISYFNSLYCNALNQWSFPTQVDGVNHYSIESNLYLSLKHPPQTPPPQVA